MSSKTQFIDRSEKFSLAQMPAGQNGLMPPVWALEQVGNGPLTTAGMQISGDAEHSITIRDAGEFALITASMADAVSMDAATFERRVADVYAAILKIIDTLSASRPVRLWNHIPAIHGQMDSRRDRYMVFNAGRYRAFSERYGGPHAFDRDVATASGIGHNGRDLIVHCLSTRGAALAVDNPRQIAPHRYSARFGPLPPCFARAMALPDAGLVLVGGTASILGEESLHAVSLPLQMRETLTNLATVVEKAFANVGAPASRGQDEWLGQFREVRVYYPRAGDAAALFAMLGESFGESCRIEMCRADLCRAELRVEIEGVASLRS
jgi:chorismate lyase/3-hydroxybenzoate synthase